MNRTSAEAAGRLKQQVPVLLRALLQPGGVPRLGVLIGCASYTLAVAVSYVAIVSPRWSYAGMTNNAAGDGAELFAVLLAVLPAAWLPIQLAAPSSLVLWLIYMLVYVPILTVAPLATGLGWQILPLAASVAVAFAVLSAVQILPRPCVRLPALAPARYALLLAAMAVVLGSFIVWHVGIPTALPGLFDVYDVRDDYKASVVETGRVLGYAVSWIGSSLGPMLLVYGIWRRRPLLLGFGIASVLLVYAVAGFKSVLFASALAVGVYALARTRPAAFGLIVPWVLTVVVAVASVAALLGSNLLVSLLVRRSIHVPGVLTGFYHDFFSTHETYRLSHSVLGWLFEQPYPESPPYLIARVYLDSPETSANANFWADGIANFGLPGLFAATLLLGVLLVVVDVVSGSKPLSVATAALSASAFSLTNSAILTSIMTHGIGLTVLLLLLLPRHRSEWSAPTRQTDHGRNPSQSAVTGRT